MTEAVLKSVFLPYKDDHLVITVDDDRVYRVYCQEDDHLSLDRNFSHTTGSMVNFATYIAAHAHWRLLRDQNMEDYAAALKRNRGSLTPDVFRRMLEEELQRLTA